MISYRRGKRTEEKKSLTWFMVGPARSDLKGICGLSVAFGNYYYVWTW